MTVDLSNSSPVSPWDNFITSAFNVPTTDNIANGDNVGSNIDFSQGVPGGQTPTNLTGNSLLDSINALSAFAGNTIQKGLGAYSSFLQNQAVINAANRLGTTPTAVYGAINTVPLTPQQGFQQGFLYLGLAAIGAVIVFKVLRKR